MDSFTRWEGITDRKQHRVARTQDSRRKKESTATDKSLGPKGEADAMSKDAVKPNNSSQRRKSHVPIALMGIIVTLAASVGQVFLSLNLHKRTLRQSTSAEDGQADSSTDEGTERPADQECLRSTQSSGGEVLPGAAEVDLAMLREENTYLREQVSVLTQELDGYRAEALQLNDDIGTIVGMINGMQSENASRLE